MEELVNISDFCNTLLIRYGQNIIQCNAVHIKEDDAIEFRIKYHTNENKSVKSFQYMIQNFNFVITDIEVLVNKSVIDNINMEVAARINQISLRYAT